MPAMLVLAGAAPFGYAKPVPVNLGQLRSPRNQGFLVSLAGPATNVALAALAVVAYRVMRPVPGTNTWEFVVAFGFVNVLLATFNMLPIPPLDGSALIERALPRSMWPGYLKVRRYSMPLLIVIVFAFPSAFAHVYEPMLRFWERLAAG
jgi:Zn-dependent protease